MKAITEEAELRASLFMDQVLKTWDPPLQGSGSTATVAQTAVIQTIAFVHGPQVLPDALTETQRRVIDEGLSLLNRVLIPNP